MPYINLIHERREAVHREERKARITLYGFLASLVVAGGMYGVVAFTTDQRRHEESTLLAKGQELKPLIKQIEEIETSISQLQPRVRTLEDAQGASTRWGRILEHLITNTPSGTWLTAIRSTQNDEKEPVAVTLVGMSESQAPIAEFMLRSQTAADLADVKLKFTHEKTVDDRKAVEFELEADLIGSELAPPEKPADEQEKK